FNNTSDAFFPITADGNGSLGNVTMQGYTLQTGSTQQTQTSGGATYSVSSNGTGTMTFPAPSGPAANALLSGAQVLAVSKDGNLFIAGSASSFNLVIGLKSPAAGSANKINSGYYFTGYLQNFDPGNFADQSTGIYGSWGSANELPSLQTELDHERT